MKEVPIYYTLDLTEPDSFLIAKTYLIKEAVLILYMCMYTDVSLCAFIFLLLSFFSVCVVLYLSLSVYV